MKLLTTNAIEEKLSSNQTINLKYFSKGVTKYRQSTLDSLTDQQFDDMHIIIDAILQKQKFIGEHNRYVNIQSTAINQKIGDKRRLSALHTLTHELGIIEVNHKYKFKGGSVSNYTKSYIIANMYKGECQYITPKGGVSICNNDIKTIKGGVSLYTNDIYNTSHLSTHNTPPSEWTTVNKTTGRVFTHINTMPKEDRALLKDKSGNTLVDVDFRTSHIQQLIKVISNDLKAGIYKPINDNLFINQVLDLKETLLNKDFYTAMANEYNSKYTRDKAKLNVMFWLTGSYNNRKFIQFMRKKYSEITHYIDYINANHSQGVKTVFYKKIPKKNGMVIRLMKSESYLVNDLVLSEMSTRYSNAIVHGIFDGFLVEQQYMNELIQIINHKGKEYLKFTPKLKVTGDLGKVNMITQPVPTRLRIEEQVAMGRDILSMPTTVDSNYFMSYGL